MTGDYFILYATFWDRKISRAGKDDIIVGKGRIAMGIEDLKKKSFPIIAVADSEISMVIDRLKDAQIDVLALSAGDNNISEVARMLVKKMAYVKIITTDVVTINQCEILARLGINVLLTPSYNERIIFWCQSKDITVIPGCSTASEIMRCLSHNINIIHLFPAEASGGISLIKEYAETFPDVMFILSGGIGEKDISKYLTCENVYAVCYDWE